MGLKSALQALLRKQISTMEPNDGDILVETTNLKLAQNDLIRQMIRQELFRDRMNDQAETFEEADDFEMEDGDQWVSPYEEGFDPPSETTPTVKEPLKTPPPAPDPTPAKPAGDVQA